MNNRTPSRILPLRGPQRPLRATNGASRVYLGQTGRPKWLRARERKKTLPVHIEYCFAKGGLGCLCNLAEIDKCAAKPERCPLMNSKGRPCILPRSHKAAHMTVNGWGDA